MELPDIRVLGGMLTLTIALFTGFIKLRNVSLRHKLAKTKRLWSLCSKKSPKSLSPFAWQLALLPSFGLLPQDDVVYGMGRADPLAFFECRRQAKKWVRLRSDGSGFDDVRTPGWQRISLKEIGRALNFAASPALFVVICIGVLVWDEGLIMQAMLVIDALVLLIGFSAVSVQLEAASRLIDPFQFPPSKLSPTMPKGPDPEPGAKPGRGSRALPGVSPRGSVKKPPNGIVPLLRPN